MQQWIKIRKDLNEQLKAHVKKLLGKDSFGIQRYQKAYESEFKTRWKKSGRDDLLHRANSSQFIFLGDFHALQQSQKAHLRILKGLDKKKSKVLFVEFLEFRHQKFVDHYLSGKISEKDFLKLISWEKNWGFPWDSYRPILRWAQKNKIPVFAIDKRNLKTLKSRDVFSAKVICQHALNYKESLKVVIYGDLHIAEKKLPTEVCKQIGCSPLDCMLVFQNSEKIYFKLLERGLEFQVDVVRLAENKFCVLNVPPWVKWQNYLMFLEQIYDRGLDQDEADLTDHVSRYVQLISKELDIDVGVSHFSIFSANSDSFWELILKRKSSSQARWFESLIENSNSFYIPDLQAGYLARPSVNHAAGLAMAIVYQKLSHNNYFPVQMPEDFLKLIWLEGIIYFGTKMVNPKRKTDTIADIKSSFSTSSSDDRGRDALRLALSQKMSELIYVSTGKKSKMTYKARRLHSYREAARLLGGMLGEKLYNAHRKKMISDFSLRSLLSKSIQIKAKDFNNVYFELIEMIEMYPEPFQSKTEKL